MEKNKATNKDERGQVGEDNQELRKGGQLEVPSEGTSEKAKMPKARVNFLPLSSLGNTNTISLDLSSHLSSLRGPSLLLEEPEAN